MAGLAGEGRGAGSGLLGRHRAGWRPRTRRRARADRRLGPDHRPRRPGQFRMAMERRPEGAAVAGANPRTIVVLTTAAPVLMPWLARTAAVIETWYPGVAGAEALAA